MAAKSESGLTFQPIVAPMILYSGVCTAILVWWPGFNTRYAMPIAPSVAVLAAIAWDRLEKSRYVIMRRVATTVLCLLMLYQFVLVTVAVPLFADRFGEARIAGQSIEQAIRAAPAPAYCLRLDTNPFFYVHVPLQCLDLQRHGGADAAGLAADAACSGRGIYAAATRSRAYRSSRTG